LVQAPNGRLYRAGYASGFLLRLLFNLRARANPGDWRHHDREPATPSDWYPAGHPIILGPGGDIYGIATLPKAATFGRGVHLPLVAAVDGFLYSATYKGGAKGRGQILKATVSRVSAFNETGKSRE